MAIHKVSTLHKRIHSGSEGGNEFARLMNLFLLAEAKQNNWRTINFNDAAGDYKGVDLIIIKNRDLQDGYQFKFYPSPLSSAHKTSIKSSIENALKKGNNLNSLNIVTPEDILNQVLFNV